MNKETMKQGMIKVLNMYDIPWGDSAIDKIINTWADNLSLIHISEPTRH